VRIQLFPFYSFHVQSNWLDQALSRARHKSGQGGPPGRDRCMLERQVTATHARGGMRIPDAQNLGGFRTAHRIVEALRKCIARMGAGLKGPRACWAWAWRQPGQNCAGHAHSAARCRIRHLVGAAKRCATSKVLEDAPATARVPQDGSACQRGSSHAGCNHECRRLERSENGECGAVLERQAGERRWRRCAPAFSVCGAAQCSGPCGAGPPFVSAPCAASHCTARPFAPLPRRERADRTRAACMRPPCGHACCAGRLRRAHHHAEQQWGDTHRDHGRSTFCTELLVRWPTPTSPVSVLPAAAAALSRSTPRCL